MNLIPIFERLKSTGYVSDQYAFDRDWLGRKPGYTAYLRSTSQVPSVATLFKLYLRLLEWGDREHQLGINGHHMHDLAEEVFEGMCTQVSH